MKRFWLFLLPAGSLPLEGTTSWDGSRSRGISPQILASVMLLPFLAQPALSAGQTGSPGLSDPSSSRSQSQNAPSRNASSREGYLGTDRGFDIYVDPNSVVATFPIVRFRLRAVATPEAGQPRSAQFEMSLDCSARILRVLSSTGFDGSGRAVANRSYTLEDPARSLASLGPIGARIHQAVCSGQGGNLYGGR